MMPACQHGDVADRKRQTTLRAVLAPMARSIESRDCINVIDPPLNAEASTIAIAIPCFNEAPAIRTVIAQFRAALSGAEIVVFDNNSTDGTADAARDEGVRVVARSRAG